MLGFTKQEQGIILFLIFTLAVGSGVRLYERLAPEEPVVNASTDFIENFNTISRRLNVASGEPSPTQFYESGQSKIALNPTLPILTPLKIASKKKNAIVKNKGQLKININSATQKELQKIPKIGPVLAQKIVDYRTEHGQFNQMEDLKKVKGIGKATLKKIEPYISLESNKMAMK